MLYLPSLSVFQVILCLRNLRWSVEVSHDRTSTSEWTGRSFWAGVGSKEWPGPHRSVPQSPIQLGHSFIGGSPGVKMVKNGKMTIFKKKFKICLWYPLATSSMGWLGSGDLNVGIWVKSDEGSPMGAPKMGKMGQKNKNWENRQKWAKNNEK